MHRAPVIKAMNNVLAECYLFVTDLLMHQMESSQTIDLLVTVCLKTHINFVAPRS